MNLLPGLLRRNPDFARLYFAGMISYAGDWFTFVALQGLVLETTGRPALAALMLAVVTLPYAMVAPFAGVIADRFDRKKLMVASDIARAAVALGFLAARSEETIWIAFVCNALLSALSPFHESPSSAAMPNLVATSDLARANVLMGSLWGTMLAVGAAVGGAVTVLFGRDTAFVLDAVSFAFSALLVMRIRGRFREREREPSHVTVAEDIRIALRFARQEPRVGAVLVAKGLFGLGSGTIALLSVVATQVFNGGDAAIGILLGARGLGALTGPFLWRRFVTRGRDDRLLGGIAAAATTFAVFYALFSQAPNIWLAALCVAGAHIGGGASWTTSSYALQRYTPDEIRGRIFSFDFTMITLAMSIAFTVSGFAADHFDPRRVALASSTWTLCAAIGWLLWARRRLRRSSVATTNRKD